jgi:hypothetical protein
VPFAHPQVLGYYGDSTHMTLARCSCQPHDQRAGRNSPSKLQQQQPSKIIEEMRYAMPFAGSPSKLARANRAGQVGRTREKTSRLYWTRYVGIVDLSRSTLSNIFSVMVPWHR